MFNKEWLLDTAERTFWTAAEAFLAIVVVAGVSGFNVATLQAAALAGVAAGLTVIKSAISAARSGTISPASSVKASDA